MCNNLSQLKLAAAMSFVALIGCAPQGDSLFGDKLQESNSMALSIEAVQADLAININSNPISTSSKSVTEAIEVNGTCFPSHYFTNNVSVYYASNNSPANYVDIQNPTAVANTAKCTNGKFSISLNIASLPFGKETQFRVIMHGIDAAGKVYVNSGAGEQILRVFKASLAVN